MQPAVWRPLVAPPNGASPPQQSVREGEDLSHVLRREGKLPVERIVKIARQLCGALDAAHSEGVVHRDLKPQNVLLDRDANCYISDFGLAKSVEAGSAAQQAGQAS